MMRCSRCNGRGRILVDNGRVELICCACNGSGEVEQTNFDRITSSPETLAEFIIDKLQYCKRPVCPICPVWKKCDGASKEAFVEWLREEHHEKY